MLSRLTRFALLAALAAVFANGAFAGVRPAASYYTPAGLRANGLRWQAEARSYSNRPAASYYTPAALHALGARMQAEARYYAAATKSTRGSNRARVIASAGAAAVAAALTVLLAIWLRRRRRPSMLAPAGSESSR
jgi:hypothetical protein